MYKRIILILVLALAGIIGAQQTSPAHATYATRNDNSTNPQHTLAWTHGSPNTGLAPGNGQSGNGYYYLKAYAPSGATIDGNCEVYSPGDWLIQFEDANKHVLMQTTTHGKGGRAWATGLHAGALYQCRISDIGANVQKDYAELHLWVDGDLTTSDCGGPGVVVDPNFNMRPMEPAHSAGLPANGCNGVPGADPYNAADPRASVPAQEQHDLGVIQGGHVYTFTTTQAGDLTAFAFYGHQGSRATITITDAHGTIVNGPKWGAMTPNPMTMTQEYVGADAGVQPAGTYQIHYSGPSNTQHVWALVVASGIPHLAAPLPALHISGHQILDASNTPVQFQGATFSGLEYRCTLGGRYSVADFAAMHAWNMNVVKIPVNPHFYSSLGTQSCNGTQAAQWAYRRAVHTAVVNAESQGLYVILTILDYNLAKHGGNPAPDRATNATLAALGHTYGSDGRILLETFSEPHTITDAVWLAGVQPQINTVNRVAPHTIVIIDGNNWSGVPGLAYSAGYRPHGANLAYAAHVYNAGHNATDANWPATFGTLAQTYPLIATEFGDTSHNCDPAWLNRLMPYLTTHTDGMLAWAWDAGTSCSRPDLLSAWTGGASAYGAPILAYFTR